MSPKKVKDTALEYAQLLVQGFDCLPERNAEATELRARLNHLTWMCMQVSDFVDGERIEKAMRWLGFLQGAMWALGVRTIEESKRDNMPPAETFEKDRV